MKRKRTESDKGKETLRIEDQQIHDQTQISENIAIQSNKIPRYETRYQSQRLSLLSGLTSATKMSSSAYVPTKETTNLSRVSHVLRCPCTDQLRDLLCNYVQPASFPQFIQEKRANLPRLTAPQRELILPSTGHYNGDYKDMDLSLLYLLLRNICNIQPHKKGWGHSPDDTDFSLSACIDRIRKNRNKIGHSTSSGLSQIDFIDQWSDIKRSVKSIDKCLHSGNNYENDVDCLLEAPMDPMREKDYFKQLQVIVKEEGVEDLRSLIVTMNESEAEEIQILPFLRKDKIDIERVFVPISIVDEYDKGNNRTRDEANAQSIKPDKMFTCPSGETARFIFMLGEAGYGKTVQCQRIAKSWCQAWKNETEEDISPKVLELERNLKQFDFLFIVKMRDVCNEHIELVDMIEDVFKRYHPSKECFDEIRQILKDRHFKSLVLLDGLDEWKISDDKKKKLIHACIPNRNGMSNCSILISMRSWKFMEAETLYRRRVDRVIRLNGLGKDGVEALTTNMLCNYFKNRTSFDEFQERYVHVKNAVSSSSTEIKSLINIPMLAVFYILTVYENVKTGNSLTTFYLSIIEALFKRSLRREQNERIRGGLSIWTFTGMPSSYLLHRFWSLLPKWLLPGGRVRINCISKQNFPNVTKHLQELTHLGKLAFKSLSSEKSNLVFTKEELNTLFDEETIDMFLKVGLVIKSEETGRFHEEKKRISFFFINLFKNSLHHCT